MVFVFGGAALFAHPDSFPSEHELSPFVVTGKAADLLGTAPAASAGQVSAEELQARPYLRRGEILEAVPGLVVTQHAGGGKANQYFLRGFNLDHGTDFAVDLEGMPVNMRTHAHGQGYADLNILIPELVARVDHEKGVYSARNGDLSSAGAAHFKLIDELPHGLASVTWGEDGYWRGLWGDTFAAGARRRLTFALEAAAYDGPWVLPERSRRWNGFARYFEGDAANHIALTFLGYRGEWQSSDQIPQRAIADGRLPRLGHVDPSAGGETQRHSVSAAWQRTEGDDVWRINAYGFYYDLDLFSNFTYFLDNPERGDAFEQAEERWVMGGEATREWKDRLLLGASSDVVVGLQARHDAIDPIGLFKTEARERFRTVRSDTVDESSVGVFGEATTFWTARLRTVAGVRGDWFHFESVGDEPLNSGERSAGIINPKFSASLGPWQETEFYVNAGTGFHSNDARGVNNTVDPETGETVAPVDPLVRTVGAELGIRTQRVPKVTLTAALWGLESDSELVYVGDAGTNAAGPASRRYGVEIAAYLRTTSGFTLDAEFAATRARFRDAGDADHVPGSIPWMFSGGATWGRGQGAFAGVRTRVLARRPLVEDNSVRGRETFLVNGVVGWRAGHWEFALESLNLFGRADNDIEYFYTSRLPGEPEAGVDDIHLHPAEPRTFRLRMTREL